MCIEMPAPTYRHFEVPDEFARFVQDSSKNAYELIVRFGVATYWSEKLIELVEYMVG